MKYCKDCLNILHHGDGCTICEGTNVQDIIITVLSNERK